MGLLRQKIGKQGTWLSALSLLIFPLVILFSFRWLLFEPFVIPSGSMEPTLKVHDHIFVKKFEYGIRLPFGDGWLVKFKKPKHGDIIVFRYPENKKVFFIKRVVGLPGDKVTVRGGQIAVNGNAWPYSPVTIGDVDEHDEAFNYFAEIAASNDLHFIKFNASGEHVNPEPVEYIVPPKSYFVMGDNRDQSRDSRFWGFVDQDLIVGKASFVWLSCDKTLETAPMICDPATLRAMRMFKGVH